MLSMWKEKTTQKLVFIKLSLKTKTLFSKTKTSPSINVNKSNTNPSQYRENVESGLEYYSFRKLFLYIENTIKSSKLYEDLSIKIFKIMQKLFNTSKYIIVQLIGKNLAFTIVSEIPEKLLKILETWSNI